MPVNGPLLTFRLNGITQFGVFCPWNYAIWSILPLAPFPAAQRVCFSCTCEPESVAGPFGLLGNTPQDGSTAGRVPGAHAGLPLGITNPQTSRLVELNAGFRGCGFQIPISTEPASEEALPAGKHVFSHPVVFPTSSLQFLRFTKQRR